MFFSSQQTLTVALLSSVTSAFFGASHRDPRCRKSATAWGLFRGPRDASAHWHHGRLSTGRVGASFVPHAVQLAALVSHSERMVVVRHPQDPRSLTSPSHRRSPPGRGRRYPRTTVLVRQTDRHRRASRSAPLPERLARGRIGGSSLLFEPPGIGGSRHCQDFFIGLDSRQERRAQRAARRLKTARRVDDRAKRGRWLGALDDFRNWLIREAA